MGLLELDGPDEIAAVALLEKVDSERVDPGLLYELDYETS